MIPRVLVIAGSDSGGGAGIQADLKTVAALGGYATTALTALTAQNTQGVTGIEDVPVPFIREQMKVVLDDIGTDAVKTGMLNRVDVIEAVAAFLRERLDGRALVVDPVMVAKGGARLLDKRATDALKRDLLPLATILTPNVPEAEEMTGRTIASADNMRHAAEMLLSLGPTAVLVKGGHLPGPKVVNILASDAGFDTFETERIVTRHTHGTGCTLASAIACGLAGGLAIASAVSQGIDYVLAAIREAPGLGKGHGPLAHFNSVAFDLYRRRSERS